MNLMKYLATGILLTITSGEGIGQDSLGIRRADVALDYWNGGVSISASEDLMYAATPCGIRILDYEDRFVERGFIETLQPQSLSVVGDKLRMILHRLGRYEIAVSSLEEPERIIDGVSFPSDFNWIDHENWVNNDSLSCINLIDNDGLTECLNIIDARNPQELRISAVIDTFDRINSLTLDGDRLFVIANYRNLTIVDLSDPDDPGLILRHQFAWGVNHMQIRDTLAVCGGWLENGVVILDISDLENIEVIGRYESDHRESPDRFLLNGDRVYFDGPTDSAPQWIKALNIANLDNPRLTWESEFFYHIWHPIKSGENLFVPLIGYGLSGIAAFSLEDPDVPEYSRKIISDGFPFDMVLTDERVYVLEGGPFAIDFLPYPQDTIIYPNVQILSRNRTDLGTIGRIRLTELDVGRFSHSGCDLVERSDTVYLAVGTGRIYDVRDPARPRQLEEIYPEGGGFGDYEGYSVVGVKDSLLFLGASGRLDVYNIINIRNIRLIGSVEYELISLPNDLTIRGELVFVHYLAGYSCFDFSDPTDISLLERVNLIESEQPRGRFAIRGDKLVGHFYDESEPTDLLSILDISDPASPQLLGSYHVGTSRFDFTFEGNLAVITAEDYEIENPMPNSLRLLDISDPENLRTRGFYNTYRQFSVPRFSDRTVYLSEGCRVASYDVAAALGENVAPMWRDVNPIVVSEGQRILFNMIAVDLNGDSLELSALNLPEGSSFIDRGDGRGTFNWQTDFTSAGAYAPEFVASDGELTDTLVVLIQVNNVNRPPIFDRIRLIEPANGSPLPEGDHLRFVWSGSFDPDSEAVIFTLYLQGYRDHFIFNTGDDTSHTVLRWNILSLMDDSLHSVRWFVSATDGVDTVYSDSAFTLNPPLQSDEVPLQALGFHLFPPCPNPFNSTLTIRFSNGTPPPSPPASGGGKVEMRLAIYDISGRVVADFSETTPPYSPPSIEGGVRTLIWDASAVPAGVYFVWLQSGNAGATKKVVLMR